MPAVGQAVQLVVCAATAPGTGNGQVSGPAASPVCPTGTEQYVIEAYVPFSSSQPFFDALGSPFDPAAAAAIFSFGFGLVAAFFLIGLKGSVLLRPFWRH